MTELHVTEVVSGEGPAEEVCYWARCSCGWFSDWTYIVEEAQSEKQAHEEAA